MSRNGYSRLALASTVLALCVVVLGAYVRLSDAGLGCPDWPGCYGQFAVPEDPQAIAQANAAFPERPVEPAKGWKEMIHRYVAGLLGLLILALAVLSLRRNHQGPRLLPWLLLAVVIFQAVLGMWTVTWQLKPVVVMGHLLGGLTTLALLWLLALRTGAFARRYGPGGGGTLRAAAVLALVVLVGQIALGGWTSANYAALACTDFPTCHQQWWPEADFDEAFVLWRGLGVNYEYGVLDNPARVAIQLAHRIGAVVTLLVLLGTALTILARGAAPARGAAGAVLLFVVLQFTLGIGNVLLSLPLAVAVAHNAVAALLLLSVVTLNHALRPGAGGRKPL